MADAGKGTVTSTVWPAGTSLETPPSSSVKLCVTESSFVIDTGA